MTQRQLAPRANFLTPILKYSKSRGCRCLNFFGYGNHVFLENNRWLLDQADGIWDLTTGQRVRDKQKDWDGSWVASSPDGKRWAGIDIQGNVAVVDLASQKSLINQHTHHDHGRSVAFSPDGKWLATASERLVLWDAATLTRIVPLEYESIVWSVAFSPDSHWLVSTHGDGAVLVWDVVQRELVANFRDHSGGVRGLTFSRDGQRVATASEDKSVVIWNVQQGRKEAVLNGHQTRATAVSFSPDGRWLASADQAGKIIRWDISQRRPVLTVSPDEFFSSYCLVISPDGRSAATTWGVLDLETGHSLMRARETLWNQVYSAVFSVDGKRLIGVTDQGVLLVVDTEKWQVIERQKWSETPLITVSISPDGQHFATGDDGKVIRLGTLLPLRQVAVIGQHQARIKAVAFSPDGKQLASAGDDKMIALWDVGRHKLITTIGTHTSPIYAIAFSPDGRLLISAEHDRSVRLYTRHRELWGFRLN